MPSFNSHANSPKESGFLTRERLRELESLSITLETDTTSVLAAVNEKLGTAMQPRAGGVHVTIISPVEKAILDNLTDEQIHQLNTVREQLLRGEGVHVLGIGYINGAESQNLREVDESKKVSYIALSVPALQEFRFSLGLPEKDFHVTLGFENGDIHSVVEKIDEDGKRSLKPIAKKQSKDFENIDIPELQFSALSGKEKQVSRGAY